MRMQLVLDSVARCAAAWQRERSGQVAELERAAHIASPQRRAQFLAGRWLASQLLARQCRGPAAAWQLSASSGQAPQVLSGPTGERPFLSIAHRGEVVVAALADVPIGVDLEIAGGLRGDAAERAEFVLAPLELIALERMPRNEQESFLLTRWTLKEAWAKRCGRGLMVGDMPTLQASAVRQGGNARSWAAQGLVLALSADAATDWPRLQGQGLDACVPQCWQVGPVNPNR